jgi:hypothetical protein
VIAEAKKQGFRKLLVTHPLFDVPNLSLEEQKEFAAEEGVFIEYAFLPMTSLFSRKAQETAEIIKTVGVENCVMSTDLGNWFNPSPPEGLRCFIQYMLYCGIKPEEVESCKTQSGHLLNLPNRWGWPGSSWTPTLDSGSFSQLYQHQMKR